MDKNTEETQQINDPKLDDLKAEVFAEEILLDKINKENGDDQDSDGYTIGDPYAEAAKAADRILAARAEKKESSNPKIKKSEKKDGNEKDSSETKSISKVKK